MNSFLKKRTAFIVLLVIILLGTFLRYYQLGQIPNGFHIDEAINGVNGNFLLHTGRDSNNNKLPLQTEVFGDYNPTGYSYLTIIPIKLFDLNEFSTRFPGAFLGSLTVAACYLLGLSIFKSQRIGLLSAFLVAVSPWHIVFSRSSEETLVSLFFVVLGFALVFLSLENKKIKFLISGVIILAVSFLMYFTPRVFVPLMFFGVLIFIYNPLQNKQNTKYSNYILYSFLFLTITVSFLIFGIRGSTNRFNQVSIFGSLGTKLIMEEQIREDGVFRTNVKVTQFFHNKFTNYSLAYISNYVDYFSGKFLFIEGGLPIWFRVEGMGLLYIVELPFLLIGLMLLAVHKSKIYKIPFLWILITPVIAAVTIDDIPNVRRSLIMFPMLEIVSAFGFFYILENSKKIYKLLILISVVILFTCNFFYFLHQYFIHAQIHRNWYRNEGFGEMIKTIKSSYDSVDSIIVTKSAGGVYPLVLFYMNYDPDLYLSGKLSKDIDYTGFGKFFFVPQACPFKDRDNQFPRGKKMIFLDKGECISNAIYQKTIYRKDGTKVFNIIYE